MEGSFLRLYTLCLRMEVRLMLISAVAADIKNKRLFLHLSLKGPQTCSQACHKSSGIRAMEVNQQQDIGMMSIKTVKGKMHNALMTNAVI